MACCEGICTCLTYEWPDCPCPELDDCDIVALSAPHRVASAIGEAAKGLLGCINLCTDEHGDPVAREVDIQWGEASVDPACCGDIAVAIESPINIESDGCFTVADWTYRLEVTWDRKCTPVQVVTAETNYLLKHLVKRLCCLMPAEFKGCRACVRNPTGTGVDNIPTGTCHRAVFTFEEARQ